MDLDPVVYKTLSRSGRFVHAVVSVASIQLYSGAFQPPSAFLKKESRVLSCRENNRWVLPHAYSTKVMLAKNRVSNAALVAKKLPAILSTPSSGAELSYYN